VICPSNGLGNVVNCVSPAEKTDLDRLPPESVAASDDPPVPASLRSPATVGSGSERPPGRPRVRVWIEPWWLFGVVGVSGVFCRREGTLSEDVGQRGAWIRQAWRERRRRVLLRGSDDDPMAASAVLTPGAVGNCGCLSDARRVPSPGDATAATGFAATGFAALHGSLQASASGCVGRLSRPIPCRPGARSEILEVVALGRGHQSGLDGQ
jgi:hypothetical protein